MKIHLSAVTVLALATSPLGAFAADADANAKAQIHIQAPSAGSKATITVDVNGKRETREIDLGNATQIQVGDGNAITVRTENSVTKTPKERRTWLGVSSDEVPDEVRAQLDLAEGTGLLVRSVVADSPAAQAGLQKNDIIVKLDDQLLTNPDQLRTLIGTRKEGESVKLQYLRRGGEATVEVKLAAREGGDSASDVWSLPNLLGKDWSTEIRKFTVPLQFQSKAVIVDKDGNILNTRTNPSGKEVAEQIEKALRESGVKAEFIDQVKRTLGEATEAVQKATSNVTSTKTQVAKELQEALQQTRRALEEARRAQEAAEKAAGATPEKAP